jgi:hypothetical protein
MRSINPTTPTKFISETTSPIAIPDVGQVYTKTDNTLYFQDGAGVEHELTTANTFYGEMYTINNANQTTINTTNAWHAIQNDVFAGEINGFTYEAGSTGVIASIANAGGGDITINDVAHGLAVDDMITVTGTTTYDAIYSVKTQVPNSFTVTALWGATSIGQWQKGANLTCDVGSAGKYRSMWSASGLSIINNEVFDFAPCLNTTPASKAEARRKFSSADYGSFSGCALMDIAEGDKLCFIVQNITGTGNLIIRTRDINLVRI